MDTRGYQNLFHTYWGDLKKIFEMSLQGRRYNKNCLWGSVVFLRKRSKTVFLASVYMPEDFKICLRNFGLVCRKLSKNDSEVTHPRGKEKSKFKGLGNFFYFFLENCQNCFLGPGMDRTGSQNLFHTLWGALQKIIQKYLQVRWARGYQKNLLLRCHDVFFKKPVSFAPAWIPEALIICFIHFGVVCRKF